MGVPVSKLNLFLMFKLPAAYFTGVRATYLDDEQCTVKVRHRWVNQNPFNSMFWAVQGMAAELSTGALVMHYIRNSEAKISMLVLNNKANFSKKATGKIMFECQDGLKVKEAIANAISTNEGQTVWLNAQGIDEVGDVVSTFSFEWTLKVKK